MKVLISNEVKITDPTPAVQRFCDENLVIANPDFAKKLRGGYWLGDTPKTLCLYRRDADNLYLPVGIWNRLLPFLPFNTKTEIDFAHNPEVDYGAKIPLWDYQELALKGMLDNYFGILQAPCGSGKTQIGIRMATDLHKKTLWLTHTADLLTQSYERAAEYIDKRLLGKITAGKVNISNGITFATVQTMVKLDLSKYKNTWDVIIVDEVHRVAGTPTSMTMFSKVLNNLAAPYKYGLSATAHRGDGLIETTFAIMGKIAYTVSEESVKDKTMDVTVQQVRTGIPIHNCCLDTDGKLLYPELVNYLTESTDRNKVIADKIVENRRHSNLILSDRLQHLTDLKALLIQAGIPETEIRMIDGKMVSKKKREERKQALEDMRTGSAKFLFATYSLGKEGLDIINLDRLHLAFPHRDFAVVTQSVGRIGRNAPGKTEAIAYDYVDNIGYCKNSWKARKTSYNKKGCDIIEGIEPINGTGIVKSLFEFTT